MEDIEQVFRNYNIKFGPKQEDGSYDLDFTEATISMYDFMKMQGATMGEPIIKIVYDQQRNDVN